MNALKYDEIGIWSEVKLDIVRKYASAYSAIMTNQPYIKRHIYIDAFAGAGVHISKQTGEFIPGSPLNALLVQPPFKEWHFIDMDGDKAANLREIAQGHANVYIHEKDCNQILESDIFSRCQFKHYCRALCLLDPYGLHLDWKIIAAAGKMKTVEIFLNFPVMDMNRNVLWHDTAKVDPEQIQRMDAFWGDQTWRKIVYPTDNNLFGYPEKATNEIVAQAFQTRLKEVAGFGYVPDPIPMKNSNGAIIYYLFFASCNSTGSKIISDIFTKYQDKGG